MKWENFFDFKLKEDKHKINVEKHAEARHRDGYIVKHWFSEFVSDLVFETPDYKSDDVCQHDENEQVKHDEESLMIFTIQYNKRRWNINRKPTKKRKAL